jgi:hypothetical protein
MGIFGKRIVLRMQDPEFGTIKFERWCWASTKLPGANEFAVSVEAPESGPSELQRQFYRDLRADLAKYKERGLVYVKARTHIPVDVTQLHIYSIQIGTEEECRKEKFVIEFADDDAHYIHVVWFEAGQPYEYGCDD